VYGEQILILYAHNNQYTYVLYLYIAATQIITHIMQLQGLHDGFVQRAICTY